MPTIGRGPSGRLNGRGGGIRTPGPLLPKQMRYQAALRPDDLFDCTVNCAAFAIGPALLLGTGISTHARDTSGLDWSCGTPFSLLKHPRQQPHHQREWNGKHKPDSRNEDQ
jgi:hypothetical protein